MQSDKMELVFILDRSGSMAGLARDTIGGYNAILKEQKEKNPLGTLTTVLFDDRYEVLHDHLALSEVRPITEAEYFVRGSTALLDAIGKTLSGVLRRRAESQAARGMVVITTDGYENASREYSLDKVREMIDAVSAQEGWQFLFLGAGIDAEASAADLGIRKEQAARFNADAAGMQHTMGVVGGLISEAVKGPVDFSKWKKNIESE